ncbi:MAG TPA: TIM-barrel domain-containing protein [Candidatus Acidoferrales bacterium]|nr:TIM-barrel domain-containing protein [Candidatus Acidoferrales bacterium]
MPSVPRINRRELLGAALLGPTRAFGAPSDLEVQIAPVSPHTFRFTAGGKPRDDGTLIQETWGAPLLTQRGQFPPQTMRVGGAVLKLSSQPLALAIETPGGQPVQRLAVDPDSSVFSFRAGDAPLLGLGEGGPQFDRRGNIVPGRSGQGGYQLRNFGGRVPINWLIGTAGWAMFIHAPYGSFDLTGPEGKFLPQSRESSFPLDLFFVTSKDPGVLMAEYARLTGYPELPALWTLGYQQSHRTLASREEILAEAKTFREKKLPCDTMIYLGTGFCPSGWNTNNTEFTFNQKVMPDPKAMFDELHREHFKVVLHVAYPTGIREMRGSMKDPCDPKVRAEQQPACYWEMHRPVLNMGVDGWWPDEGDALDAPSRLVRNRMYWDAMLLDRPDERPFALNRNGQAGMQRYAAFLWSGDVNSEWATLRNHVPVAVNIGLTGVPYWGTDIGGFVPTREFTGELYLRWFQFGAFCPLFRSHGRTWKLRLPWGWNTGDPGPIETNLTPNPSLLHDARVEPICRQYLELRSRLMPYLYSVVREGTRTGLPVMRALWLHHPDDPAAVARGDEYLWGRDILVAPVTEPGAISRKLYLPRGAWYDWWTGARMDGGREIARDVDLATTPLYVRAGAIIPTGPVKQYTAEQVDAPLTVSVYPGADGGFLHYEDAGNGFAYRKGEWMGMELSWADARKTLSVRLARGSKVLAKRELQVKMGEATRRAVFDGRALQIRFS